MARSRREKEQRERQKVSAKRRVETHKEGGDNDKSIVLPKGVSQFQITESGSYRFDVLPYAVGTGNPYADKGSDYYERTYYVHRGVGPNNEVHTCNSKTFGTPCAICDYRAAETKKGTDWEDLKDSTPKERQLFALWDHKDKDKNAKVWNNSFHLFGKALDAKIRNADEEDGYAYFADPVDGFTLRVGATEEKSGGFRWIDCSDIEFRARKQAIPQEVLDSVPCLDDCIVEADYNKLKTLFLQTDDEGEDTKATKGRKGKETKDTKDKAPAKGKGKKEATADEFGLKKGMLVMYKEMECEIMKVSPDGTSLTLEDEEGETYKAVGPDEVSKLDEEPDEEDDEDLDDEEDEDEDEDLDDDGVDEEEDDEDDEEEDDIEDDDDDDEEDEDEDDEPVAKKKPAKGKAAVKKTAAKKTRSKK